MSSRIRFNTNINASKTQFTIKAFKGCRRLKILVKQVAIEYSNGYVQWINKNILKKGHACEFLKEYLLKIKHFNKQNIRINKKGIALQ